MQPSEVDMVREETCPECNAKWSKKNAKTTRLLGVFSLDQDRVIQWMCPDCKTKWDVETGKKVEEERCS